MTTNTLFLALSLCPVFAHAASIPATRQLLWAEPKPLTSSQWAWGPRGEAGAPQPPFRFLRENLGGTNPKVDIIDARGLSWIVKFGGEVHAETFMSRLLPALGYLAEPMYFVPEGVIVGAQGLRRAKPFVGKDGAFRCARFKLRDASALAYADEFQWSWNANPFLRSHALNGLKILMMLVSNWDAKDARDGDGSNTAVFVQPDSQPKTYIYSFTDWGSTLGSWGGFFRRDRWDAAAYERQTKKFVKGVQDGTVVLGYRGKHTRDIRDGISVADVRWLLPYLCRISDDDLRAGLVGSGATAPTAARIARSMRDRIAQLQSVAGTDLLTEGRP